MSGAPRPPPAAAASGPAAARTPAPAPAWDSTVLLGGTTQALIVHRGQTYRLQLTRQGKLILTK